MPNSPPNSEGTEGRFFALFAQHWDAGTGLTNHDKMAKDREGRWSVRTFGNAMEWAGFAAVDPDTIQSWLDGKRWPQKARKDAILKVFFRPAKGRALEAEAERLRVEMEQAWQEGHATRNYSQPPARDEGSITGIWIGARTPFATPGVASLVLDSPQQGNEQNAPWYVRARLRIDVGEYEAEDGQKFWLGLRRAFMNVDSVGCRVINGSMIGDKARQHSHFAGRPNGADVVGPKPEDSEIIIGDPLGDDYIAQVSFSEEAGREPTITVSLHAFRSDFCFKLRRSRPASDADPVSLEKDRVLSVLLTSR